MLSVTLLATVVGAALALRLIQRLVRPLRLVLSALRAYREEAVAPALPLHGTDEIARLTEEFTALVSTLEGTLDRLRRQAGCHHSKLRRPSGGTGA